MMSFVQHVGQWLKKTIRTAAVANVGRSCALCNNTLPPRTSSHQVVALRTDILHHTNIRNIVIERLLPLEVHASHFICHPCWQKVDRAAKRYSAPSSSRSGVSSNQLRCANCGINLIRQRRHILNNNAILLQIQERVAPQVVTANDNETP